MDLYGLIFPSNYTAGSDIGLDWTGAALLPRVGHTAIWKIKFVQQTGYYAVVWHSASDDSWTSTAEFGTHPYPAADGTVDGSGQALTGTSGSGTDHWFEVAGLSGHDYLRSAGESPGWQRASGVWYTQARTCEDIGGGTVRHTFYPDIDNNPSRVIVQDYSAATIAGFGLSWKFRFGASPWRSGQGGGPADSNDETPSGTLRHLLLYDRALSLVEIQAKTGLAADDTSDPDVWYSNINPRPTDVSDKSGAGHSPSWANANRPTEYFEAGPPGYVRPPNSSRFITRILSKGIF